MMSDPSVIASVRGGREDADKSDACTRCVLLHSCVGDRKLIVYYLPAPLNYSYSYYGNEQNGEVVRR